MDKMFEINNVNLNKLYKSIKTMMLMCHSAGFLQWSTLVLLQSPLALIHSRVCVCVCTCVCVCVCVCGRESTNRPPRHQVNQLDPLTFIFTSIYTSIYMSIYLNIFTSIYRKIYPSTYSYIYLFTCAVNLCIHLSINWNNNL